MTDQSLPTPDGPASPIQTDYEIGQHNIQPKLGPFGLDIHNPVFAISALTIIAFVLVTLAFQDSVGPLYGDLRVWLTETLDWFFIGAANVFVLLCLFLIVSPYGKVRIGGRDATPDYSYTGWLAMLFAAGMGIGLMFFGVSEPISHYSSSVAEGAGTADSWAPLAGAAGDPEEARRLGMAATIFHWGLHPWAIYAIVALSLAIFSYNKGLPLTVRSVLYPIFGEKVWGWTGQIGRAHV
jgi:BCCT family betaine/carnitine transporter